MAENSNKIETTVPPSELRLSNGGKMLQVSFEDGRAYDLTAELLRVESPSAEVQGHSAAEKRTVGGKLNVTITGIDPVGNYAVRLTFDDGHDTGLYTWEYLDRVGKNQKEIWTDYLERLSQFNLSRE
ncbi:MAG TPA: DUF971 domain-containing protein [Rhizobiales bacterium]|nr:DUF971 domain-containing protein [Hyphomicrobiales bacterium]